MKLYVEFTCVRRGFLPQGSAEGHRQFSPERIPSVSPVRLHILIESPNQRSVAVSSSGATMTH